MRVAFYAPLNPPDGPTPSGDRLIGRMLMRALIDAGHVVQLASRFRSFDRTGDAERQVRLSRIGSRLAERFLERHTTERPDIWITYHLYHKAPDHLGPIVARGFGIPYVIVEASVTPSAASGGWAVGHRHVSNALARADLVAGLNPRDRAGVLPHLKADTRYVESPVFIDGSAFRLAVKDRDAHRSALAARTGAQPSATLLLAVGMMRSKDKLDSYRLLAEALRRIEHSNWHLAILGDGPLMVEARAAFAPLQSHVTFLGRVPYDRLPQLYAGADLLVWPAIKEALGMCFLEAQSAGTPVVGAGREGVASLIRDGETGLLPTYGDADDFAKALSSLIGDRGRLAAMREAAYRHAETHHDLTTAGPRFAALVASARGPAA
jgi:glycosyltransferase involved in cell wall biosynthesis